MDQRSWSEVSDRVLSVRRVGAEEAIVLRALVAAAGVIRLLGAGAELATETMAAARKAVELAGASGGDARAEAAVAAAEAKTSRQAFAAWAGPTRSGVPTNPAYPLPPATGVPNADAALDAVMAAASAAGSYAKGDQEEARRLANNALRFATVATGGEVDWTAEEEQR